jgi:hypothetical protein
VAAQRREENLLNRPLKAVCGGCLAILAVAVAAGLAGWLAALPAGLLAGCAAVVGLIGVNAIWQGERALAQRVSAEHRRVSAIRADSESKLFAWQAEHAARVREWQTRRVAYDHQKRWYAVATPDGTDRVDVAGGTLAGWSALLTTAAAHRLADGGEVTVLDLTEAAVALDLIAAARSAAARPGALDSALEPQVWVLPDDLPGLDLDLGTGLGAAALADVLSLAVGTADDQSVHSAMAVHNAILERVMDVLGGTPSIAALAAGLRTLGQVGDPADDVAAGLLTAGQADRLRVMFGNGATDHVVIEHAWTLEAQLRKLAALGTGPAPGRRAALRVMALSGQAGVLDGKVLAAYLAVALTQALRQEGRGLPWRHTLFVLGADRLRGEVLDRLSDACESTGTGLVLAYRTIAPHVKERLGRGNATVAFMRLGNAEDARAASEQIGAEHRFVLSQLTETIGRSVTDTSTGSYTSTVGGTGSLTRSRSSAESTSVTASRGRSTPPGGAAQATASRGTQDGESRTDGEAESVSAGISASTAWGLTTSAADGGSESLARTAQRSRELLVEQHELQQLPPSALIVSYAGPAGREVVLADANPGIGGLRDATLHAVDESRTLPAGPAGLSDAGLPVARSLAEEPNLGPPPPRLDWRRGRY